MGKLSYLAAHLIGKVVRMEDDFHVARLADEGLRLLGFATEHPGLSAVGHVCFRVAVNNLERD